MTDIRDNPDCPTVGSTWFLDSPPATAHVTGFLGTSQLVYSVTAPPGRRGSGYVADLPRWLARHPVLVGDVTDPPPKSTWEKPAVEGTIPAPGTYWTLGAAGLLTRSRVLVTINDGESVMYDCLDPRERRGFGFKVSLATWAARDPQPVDHSQAAPSVERGGLAQVGGDHYERMGVQPWDVIEASPWLDYWTGTALKYVMRAGQGLAPKVEDLRKAAHFIAKAIELEEKA